MLSEKHRFGKDGKDGKGRQSFPRMPCHMRMQAARHLQCQCQCIEVEGPLSLLAMSELIKTRYLSCPARYGLQVLTAIYDVLASHQRMQSWIEDSLRKHTTDLTTLQVRGC